MSIFNKFSMTRIPSRKRAQSARTGQRGFALAELMLALVVVGALIGGGFIVYSAVRGGVSASDMGDKTIMLASDIQKHWRAAGSYGSISPAEVNKLSLFRSPLRYDGTNLYDAWGNVMTLSGGNASFGLTIGGATQPLSQDDCAAVVARLASLASNVRIGSDATVTWGVISGGSVYKNGATITQAGLTTGCSATGPIIAVQFR